MTEAIYLEVTEMAETAHTEDFSRILSVSSGIGISANSAKDESAESKYACLTHLKR